MRTCGRLCRRACGIFFCILPTVLTCAAAGTLMLPLAAAVCLHEAAHILVLRAVGGRLRDFRAAPFGLRLEMDESTLSTGGEALAAAAGSGANLLCALLAFGLYAAFDIDLVAFGLLNLFCALFNLLPALPLDGGRLLYLALAAAWDPCRAARAAAGVSLFLSLAVFLAASYRLLTMGQGLYALLFSLYLLTVAAKSGGLAVSSKNGG